MTKEGKRNMRGAKYAILATAFYLMLTSGVSALKTENNGQDNPQNPVPVYQDSLTFIVDANYNLNYKNNDLEGNIGDLDIESRKIKVLKTMPKSKSYLDMVYKKSLRKGIIPEEFCAIIENESNWDPGAISYMGCKGLSQMNPRYHKLMDYYNPNENLDAGTSYYEFLRNKFETREEAIAAYHTGQNRVSRWLKLGKWDGKSIGKISSKRTKIYVKKVLSTLGKINDGG